MPVNSNTAEDRRDVHYDSFQDLVADAERLAAGKYETLGNWTFSQILFHVTAGLHATVDGFGFLAPWPMRVMANLLMKKKFLKKPVPAGYKIPAKLKDKFEPPDLPLDEAIADLRSSGSRRPNRGHRIRFLEKSPETNRTSCSCGTPSCT